MTGLNRKHFIHHTVLRGLGLLSASAWSTLLGAPAARAQAPASGDAAPSPGSKVALVIGNSAYPGQPLRNPGNDARAVAQALKAMGYSVIQLNDASRRQMDEGIAEAGRLLSGRKGVALLYYAGHGLQLDWRNYLVPVDARLAQATDVAAQTVDVQRVIDTFKAAGSRVNILVLDACRDNPFGPGARSAQGLAPMDAPPGTFLAYATAPGNVAEDGSAASGNGLYTQFLVQELAQREAHIEDIFKRVRLQVRQASQGRQVPWESTSLEEDFVLGQGRTAPAPALDRMESDFNVEKADWDAIKTSTRPQDFYAFLLKHPGGFLAELAQFRLDQLQASALPAPAAVSRVPTLASGKPRWALGDVRVTREVDELKQTTVMHTHRVTSIDDDVVTFNRGGLVYNQMGAVLKNRWGVKDPPLMTAPADIAVGKRWRNVFRLDRPDGVSTHVFDQCRAVSFEEVAVPAGRFMAFKVERLSHGQAGWSAIESFWIEPARMHMIRMDREARNRRQEVVERLSIQEVSFTPGR
jgi:hypothetical protein